MAKVQAKTKREIRLQERLVYRGIQKEINGKAVFLRQCICYEGCLEQIVEKLQDEGIAQKLKYSGLSSKGPGVARLMLHEDDLALLYDEVFQGRMGQLLKKTEDPIWEVYALPMSMNGEELQLDVTYPLAYGIVTNERCRQQLAAEIQDRNEYYVCYDNSRYKNTDFEGFFRAEQIWDARLIVGLLEKMRQEEGDGSYRLLMKIIYAGYGHLKRQMKGREVIDGVFVKGIFRGEVSIENSMLPTVSRIMVLMAIAEDLGVRYLWDYETLVLYHFYASSVDMLTKGERTHAGYEDFSERGQEEFLQKYNEKNITHRSMLGLLCASEDRLGELLVRIFGMYQISPRKFWEYDLSQEEADSLIRQSERWSLRTYATGLILAQLCKYIRDLEERYLKASQDYAGMQVWLARQEKEAACWQRQQRDRELRQILTEKQGLADTILKQEQEIQRLQKQLDIQKEEEAAHLQELTELRSYVHSLSEDQADREPEDPAGQRLAAWKDRRVLVVGGHVNWQNKMRELFPRWQYISPGQNSLDSSAIRGKDLIICNTEVLAHSCYYKVLSGRRRQQKLYYVHSSNIQKCLRELELQLLA